MLTLNGKLVLEHRQFWSSSSILPSLAYLCRGFFDWLTSNYILVVEDILMILVAALIPFKFLFFSAYVSMVSIWKTVNSLSFYASERYDQKLKTLSWLSLGTVVNLLVFLFTIRCVVSTVEWSAMVSFMIWMDSGRIDDTKTIDVQRMISWSEIRHTGVDGRIVKWYHIEDVLHMTYYETTFKYMLTSYQVQT